jgi:hypothetical protein
MGCLRIISGRAFFGEHFNRDLKLRGVWLILAAETLAILLRIEPAIAAALDKSVWHEEGLQHLRVCATFPNSRHVFHGAA